MTQTTVGRQAALLEEAYDALRDAAVYFRAMDHARDLAWGKKGKVSPLHVKVFDASAKLDGYLWGTPEGTQARTEATERREGTPEEVQHALASRQQMMEADLRRGQGTT